MQTYRNLGGNSGIAAYVSGADFVTVQFNDGWMYIYTSTSAGIDRIASMKLLAASGRGLNAFINRHVRTRYARKMRVWEYSRTN